MQLRTIIIAVVATFMTVGAAQAAITIETVTVGNPGNAGELSGPGAGGHDTHDPDRVCGAVAYTYKIGKYEVTAGQYCEFLNAVAKTDTYGLYNPQMNNNGRGCQITRHGTSGSFAYDFSGRPSGTEADWANRPVNFVSWGDAARFVNWLQNGQPTGAQGLLTTEDGAYYLNDATTSAALVTVTRKPDARYAIPTEDEWYKAAYYDPTLNGGNGGYWDYATRSNSISTTQANYNHPSGMTVNVGSYAYSSSYGTFDQTGNVWEWNEAIISASDTTFRGDRGGSFATDADGMDAPTRSSYFSYIDMPSDENAYIGFRIVEVPEPATMCLLMLGGLAMIRRRRK